MPFQMSLARWPRCLCGDFCSADQPTCGREICQINYDERATLHYHARALVAAVAYIIATTDKGKPS